jgi:ELWxxDGT repeat protein
MVKNINPSGDSYPNNITVLGSAIYFEASNGTNGAELWKSDGTEAGTVMVEDIDPIGGSGPDAITRHGDLLYFQAYDGGENGYEMYLSDGTEAGTMRIPAPTATDYINCDCYDNPVMSTSIGVFFTYYDSTVGHELGFIADRLPETNTNSSALTLALLALSGALAAGAVIARRTERRAN